MKPLRSYDKVNEAIGDQPSLYNFFSFLQEDVYSGVKASELRERLNLPIIDASKVTNKSISKNTPIPIPYWEIHYYDDGFTDRFLTTTYFNRKVDETHIYFTLRSLIPDSHYNELKSKDVVEWKKIHNYPFIEYGVWGYGSEPYEVYYTGRQNCKIDKYYTGDSIDQYLQGEWREEDHIQIIIIEDSNNNMDFFSKIVPEAVSRCLKTKDMKDVKMTDLPQMLFIGSTSHSSFKSKNTDSIVCIDSYGGLFHSQYEKGEVLEINGNVFINKSALVSANDLGKNCLLKKDSLVLNCSVGDNVVISDSVELKSCKIDDYCIITKGAYVAKYYQVPAFQIITSSLPLFLKPLEHIGLSLQDLDITLKVLNNIRERN